MFFGETDRTLRVQQQQQYAEELRKQIEEKQRKVASPSPYSTTTRDVFKGGSGSRSGLSPRPLLQRGQNQQQQPSAFRHAAIPDLAPTSLAPLSINLAGTMPRDTLTQFQKTTIHAMNADPDSFPDRIDIIEAKLEELHQNYSESSELADDMIHQILPSMQNKVQEIRASITQCASSEITARVRPVKEAMKSQRHLIDMATQNVASSVQQTRQLCTELTGHVSAFQGKLGEVSESSKTSLISSKNDMARLHIQQEQAESRSRKLTERHSAMITKITEQNGKYDRIDSSTISDFERLQSSVNSLVSDVVSQLGGEISGENEKRGMICAIAKAQIEQVNDNSSSGMNRLSSLIETLTGSLKESLESLAGESQAAIEQTQTETDMLLQDTTARFDSLVSETENNFRAIQEESIATISSMKGTQEQTRNAFEVALVTESETRARNAREVMEKYSKFGKLIEQEAKLHQTETEEAFKKVTNECMDRLGDMITIVRRDVTSLAQQEQILDASEAKITEFEKTMVFLNSQFAETIGNLNRNYSQMVAKIDSTKHHLDKALCEMEEKLDYLEDPALGSAFARKHEIHDAARMNEQAFDKKVSGIEKQIGMMLTNLAALSVPNHENDQTGSDLIASLVGKSPRKKVEQPLEFEFPHENEPESPESPEPEEEKKENALDNLLKANPDLDDDLSSSPAELVEEEDEYQAEQPTIFNTERSTESISTIFIDSKAGSKEGDSKAASIITQPDDGENEDEPADDEDQMNTEDGMCVNSYGNGDRPTLDIGDSAGIKFNPDDFKFDFGNTATTSEGKNAPKLKKLEPKQLLDDSTAPNITKISFAPPIDKPGEGQDNGEEDKEDAEEEKDDTAEDKEDAEDAEEEKDDEEDAEEDEDED